MKQNTLVVAIVSGAVCFAIGLVGGTLLTMPDKEEAKAIIAAAEAKANEAQAIAQEKLQITKAEITRLKGELKRVTTELKQPKDKIAAEKEVGGAEVQEREDNVKNEAVDGIKITSKPMFGIYLGEKLSDVQKRFETTKHPLNKWAVHHTSTAVEDCHINICKDRVWCITAWLKDNTETNFNTLKRQLKKEYVKYQFREVKSSDSKHIKNYEFTITLDDVPVLIAITFINNSIYDGLSKKDNELSIQYIHRSLMGKEK